MNAFLSYNDVLKLYPEKFVVAVTVRNKSGIAEYFSIVNVYENVSDAIEQCEKMRNCKLDTVLLPCFTEEFHNVMTTEEIAYMLRGYYSRQCDKVVLAKQLSFDEIIAIFFSVIKYL